MGESLTDKKLVERAQKGDKKAFGLLVLKYQQRIINLVSRFVGDPSMAQDVAQDAFIKAYLALPNFRGDSAFYTWIYRIAANTAKNYLSVRSRNPLDTAQDINNAEQIEGEYALRDHQTPEDMLIRDEIQEVIINTIENLPGGLKVAITLREIEGLSYEEIAHVMDCPIGTVRSRIFRAREVINDALGALV